MSTLFKAVTKHKDDGHAEASDSSSIKPKTRILILSSRGITYRHRHLLNDLVAMLPNSKKDAKLDTKNNLSYLNEIAELYSCNGVMFFEARKHTDLYLWISRAVNGPCVKFHVLNLHTASELSFTGNCLRGSRPIVSFDRKFESTPALALVKELLAQTFSVPPRGVRKAKPFIDRVVSFTVADGKIWCRHFQIKKIESMEKEKTEKEKEKDEIELVEIGPRFVLTPIVILEGSFGGPVVYENREFVSPNAVRAALRQKTAVRAGGRDAARVKRTVKKKELAKEQMMTKQVELDNAVLFA